MATEETAGETPETPKIPVEVQIADTGPCKKQVRIVVPKARADEEEKEAYDRFIQQADIPGFRRGHTPKSVIKKRYGKELRDELQQHLVGETFQEAAKTHRLRPLGHPVFDKIEWKPEEGLAYEVTLEVKPDIEVKDYLGISASAAPEEVHPGEIDAVIQQIRYQGVVWKVLPKEEAATKGDQVVCRISLESGEWKTVRENVPLYAAAGTVLGIPIGDLELALSGATPGGVLEREGAAPDSFPEEAVRGKTVRVRLEFLEIKRGSLPEATDEWAKTQGADTIEDLRERIRIELRMRKAAKAETDARAKIEEHLLKAHDFLLPEDILKKWHEVSLDRIRLNLRLQGVPDDKVEEEIQKVQEASKEAVVRELKRTLILEGIAEKENIQVSEQDFEGRISEMARAHRTQPAVIRKVVAERELEDTLRAEVREEKVFQFLLEKAAK
ncbi:MAG: trigger factor [Planctomycetota bacterium]